MRALNIMKRKREKEEECTCACKRRRRVYNYKTPDGCGRRAHIGGGLFNTLINKLPFPIHLPGYNHCGPGTRDHEAPPKNILDSKCRVHDLVRRDNPDDLKVIRESDKELVEEAWKRVISKDARLGERANAWIVTSLMKAKLKLGLGVGLEEETPVVPCKKRKLNHG